MNLKEKLKELPKNPGCYLMKNINNEIIYVGKAKNLYNRVRSYFIGSHNAKTTRLVMDITDFEYIITSSETEAFILENNLIKKHHPKYNIMLMDDKTYPYICISNEKNPRIYYTRDLNKKGKFFGPYPNPSSAKEIVDMLNKIYPLRKCNNIPKKECLYYHINNCLAPCIKNVDNKEYEIIINEITKLLNGNTKDAIKKLEIDMNNYSNEMNYEKALECKNLIDSLNNVCEKQKMESNIIEADCINFAIKKDFLNIQIFQIRNTKLIARKNYTFDILDNCDELFIDFIYNFYLVNNNPIPKEIILPNCNPYYLPAELTKKIIMPKKGKKKELLDLVLVNINKELDNSILDKERTYELTTGSSIKLKELLGINSTHRIEIYDNSNICGSDNVSSMVVYIDGIKSPKDYRKYKIKSKDSIDDTSTFKEVLTRRFTRSINENTDLCDLIIMDGGKGQVNAAIEVLNSLNLNIPVIGLIKDDYHRTKSILYNNNEIEIDKHSDLFKFLANMQEEVHRFAITYFRSVHAKNMISSRLDEIKGIGKIKKQMVLDILGEENFIEKLNKLPISENLKEEIKKIYND